jgi:glucuronosyltransferase
MEKIEIKITKRMFCILLFLTYLWTTCLAARILVLSPLGPRSHMNLFMPMVETLVENGHQLTVVTAHPPPTKAANISKIVMDEMVELIEFEWYDFKEHSLYDNMSIHVHANSHDNCIRQIHGKQTYSRN